MGDKVKVAAEGRVPEEFMAQVRRTVDSVLERAQEEPPEMEVRVWESMDSMIGFLQEEKQRLGVSTEGEEDFLAVHEAWAGGPRIHVCRERVKGLPETVIRGALQHEAAHAFLHGSPEFYAFRFTTRLQDAARASGMDFPLLQQYVYLLSIAVKDAEVAEWLGGLGLSEGQAALIRHDLEDVRREREIWGKLSPSPAGRRLALSLYLKTLASVAAVKRASEDLAKTLEEEWTRAFSWLPAAERLELNGFADSLAGSGEGFQERLEAAALRLLGIRDQSR